VVTDIRHINPTAVLITSTQSSVPIEEILNIQSFDVRRYERDNKGKNDEEGRRINITRGVFQIETNSEGKIILPKKKKRNRTRSEEKGDGQGQGQGQGQGEEEEIVRAEKLDIMKSDSVQEEGGVSTISLTSKKPLDLNQFNRWISSFLKEKGNDIYRFKGQHSHFSLDLCFTSSHSLHTVGILAMKGYDKKFVAQGIHMLFNGEVCDDWEVEESSRKSKLVFIGVDLPHQQIKDNFERCVHVDEPSSMRPLTAQKKED
jgi:G3E family GTPase